jgi:MOSC domain-containing protein YiiM
MKLVSVNTGLPREVSWHGRIVTTAIFKEPTGGRVALRKLNLDGDRQADLTVHGGEHKAVYCYPLAHYGYWKREFIAQKTRDGAELPRRELPMGSFGENFTIVPPHGRKSEDAALGRAPLRGREEERGQKK